MMSNLREIQQQIGALRHNRDLNEASLRQNQQHLLRMDKQIASLERMGENANDSYSLERLKREREDTVNEMNANRKVWLDSRGGALNGLVKLLELPPWTLLEQIPDNTPFLLLPIKIETKFGKNIAGAPEIWVRIFPDTIAADSHEEELMDIEVEGARAYWTAIWEARDEPLEELEDAKKGAWNALSLSFNPQRSSYIAWKTKPLNWSEDLAAIVELQFPESGPTKTEGWTKASRTHVMPDRFVVSTFMKQSGQFVEALPPVIGKHVPDNLALGPDPSQLEEKFGQDDDTGELILDPEMAWLADFDKAIEVGMGLKIPLTSPYEQRGFDRLVVLGLRLSTNAEDSARMVEELLEGHRFTSGISFMQQGTPTNNMEDVSSGFASFDPSNEESYNAIANAANPMDWTGLTAKDLKKDGQRFAEALGLDYSTVAPIENSNREDIAEAMAMNAALWPATLGEHFQEMLGRDFDEQTREQLERFFLENITGRGQIPVLRVGNQPYGVLVTSSLDRWQWGRQEPGNDYRFYEGFLEHIKRLTVIWKRRVNGVKFAGDHNEPFQRLLDIAGLNATSVDYFSRKAATDNLVANYYNFQGFLWKFFNPTWLEMQMKKKSDLAIVGLDKSKNLKIGELLFLKERDHLYGPVVDGDPDLPLSESDTIRPYFEDDTLKKNYIDWLLESSLTIIEKEKFANKEGKKVPPPKALLYMLLRQSLLNQVVRSGKVWLLTQKITPDIPALPNLLNFNGEKFLSGKDMLNVGVLQAGNITLGEHIIQMARIPELSTFDYRFWPVAETRKAFQKLNALPTARLERLFAEHIDLCSYRMDAWINGIFQKRLSFNREKINSDIPNGNEKLTYNQGLYLGAYGWVENLKPRSSSTKPVEMGSVPEELRKPEKGPIVSDSANGGYILSPSMNHAVSAAILRNAYLSHADKDKSLPFSVNLSSRRVRTAMSYLEGMRNGQSLAALLGYQIERTLHDNPDGLELDEYIYTLRDRFPYSTGKLAEVPEGTSTESVEASNVVNGYDLLNAVKGKSYPYGFPIQPDKENGLPAVGSVKAKAIQKAIDALSESLDSISDLALSESVYQVVQGNYERAGGMLQALAEGKTPPEPDIVNTPRNGKTITQRMAITLKPDAPASVPGWGGATVRSKANKPVNHWLFTMLPESNNIGFEIDKGGVKKDVKLSDVFDLQPIDLVLMSGNNLGDQSSELERYLLYKIKVIEGMAEGDSLSIDFRKEGGTVHSLNILQPLLRTLRKVITEARPMHAQDLLTGIEAQKTAPENPQGLLADANNFLARVRAVYDSLKAETDEAGSGLAAFYKAQIEGPFAGYFDDADHTIDPAWEARLDQIRSRLISLVQLALTESVPATTSGFGRLELEGLVAQVQSVLNILKKRLKEVDNNKLLDAIVIDPDWKASEKAAAIEIGMSKYGRAAKIMLNQNFVALPFFTAHNSTEIEACMSQSIESDVLELEKWLQGIGKVRQKMGNLTLLAGMVELLFDRDFIISPIQIPYDATAKWVGKEFENYTPANDTTSIVLHTVETPNFNSQLCGLLLDEWTEVIPEKEVNAGISFHFNRPNAMPPQALLLAVSPKMKGNWEWDDLMAILHETLERAKMRCVEPNHLLSGPTFQALPAVMTEFTNFSFRTILHQNVTARVDFNDIQPIAS